MDFDRQALIESFHAESIENLAALEEALLSLERDTTSGEHLNTIFRHAHSLKGNALCVGFENIGNYIDGLEDFLEHLRDRTVGINASTITRLLQIADGIREWIPEAIQNEDAVSETCTRILNELLEIKTRPAAVPGAQAELPSSSVQAERSQTQTVRVDLGKLDQLLNVTTEMVIACSRINAALQMLPADVIDRVTDSLDAAQQLSRELDELVLRARMVPIGTLFRQYTRVVRDVGRELGKSCRLIVEGGDVEVDVATLEYLRDPLTHLVRNSIDHGLESADVRTAAGKDPVGTVTLSARQEGRSVVVRVVDDGRGLDEERILARARERQMVAAGAPVDDEEIRNLIFQPGFTTAAEVTKISGRGVGLDVVKANIELLRGDIAVESVRGQGLTLTIRLPLTVAAIDGLVVSVGGETYIVPLDAVVECTELGPESRNGRSSGIVTFHEQPIPFGRLGALVGCGFGRSERENLLVVRHHDRLVGIVVDEILKKDYIVIKPLDDWYSRVPFVSGSTIVGDGQIALILDVRAAVDLIEAQGKPKRGVAA